MKKTLSIVILVILMISMFVGCDYNSTIEKKEESYLEVNYVLKSSYDEVKKDIEWLKGLGIERSSVKTIIFSHILPAECVSLTGVDITEKGTGKVLAYTDSTKSTVWIVGDHFIANPDCRTMFKGFSALTSVQNLSLLDISKVSNSGNMFADCSIFNALKTKLANSKNDEYLVMFRPISATSNSLGSKVGESTAVYLGNILVSSDDNDNSIATAAKNGGIKKISTVDEKIYLIDSFRFVTTIVTGE